MKATDELKQEAKAAGIKSWHMKSQERLEAELKELQDEQEGLEESSGSSDSIDSGVVQEPEEEVLVEEPEALVLPTDVSRKLMDFSIKCAGSKSPYYKYKDLL